MSLQPEEVVKAKSPSKNSNKDTSSRSMTVARYHEVTLGLTHSQLILPIPLHITPAFEVDEGNYTKYFITLFTPINYINFTPTFLQCK